MSVLNLNHYLDLPKHIARAHLISQSITIPLVESLSKPFTACGIKKEMAGRNIYYFMFMTMANSIHAVAPLVGELASISLIILLGGLMQGYHKCPPQKKLDELQKSEKPSLRGFLAGAAGAVICCYASAGLSHACEKLLIQPARILLSQIVLLSLHEKLTVGTMKNWFSDGKYEETAKDNYKGMCWLESLFLPKNAATKNNSGCCCTK